MGQVRVGEYDGTGGIDLLFMGLLYLKVSVLCFELANFFEEEMEVKYTSLLLVF